MAKRQDYISWDEYFMGISLLSCLRSKDPNTQVGACIVNGDNHIVSVGYNGLPRGCSDDEYPWDRTADAPNKTKYPFVCHAERDLHGCTLYVSLFPCNECAKAIIQSGINEVIYISDKYADSDATLASKRMLASAGVKLTRFASNKTITISFDEKEV